MIRRMLIGLVLVSSLAFADKVKIMSEQSLSALESRVNEFIHDKHVKDISIATSKAAWYIVIIRYDDKIYY